MTGRGVCSFFFALFVLLGISSLRFAAGANVKDILCGDGTENQVETVTLKPGESFSLTCGSKAASSIPPNFVTHACSGTGASCGGDGVTYADLFPKASKHTFVQPNDPSVNIAHTWTAPSKGDLDKTATVFSIGCQTASAARAPTKCYVDVTVSDARRAAVHLSAGIVLFLSTLAIYQSSF